MSLADRIKLSRRKPCKLTRIIDGLPPEEQAVVRDWLEDSRVSNAAIARALTEEGHFISNTAVNTHVNGDCGCPE